jgi:hypothetical protein
MLRSVWETLAPVLPQHGFRVLNPARPIGFPAWHRDAGTVAAIRETLNIFA